MLEIAPNLTRPESAGPIPIRLRVPTTATYPPPCPPAGADRRAWYRSSSPGELHSARRRIAPHPPSACPLLLLRRAGHQDLGAPLARVGLQALSKDTAKQRLKLVLIQDRLELAPDKLEEMKQEIWEVVSKYMVVKDEFMEFDVRRLDELTVLVSNIEVKDLSVLTPAT